MNKRVVRRLLETFFRRWWLYLLPLVLFASVGIAKGLHSSSGFRSVGVVDVSKGTLLSQLTSVRGETFGYETPAASTARTMASLLRTETFIESVAEKAGVTGALKQGQLTAFGLRQSIFAAPDGDTLLQVSAITDNPALSARLVSATIESFIEYVVAGDVSDSRAAETFFDSQLDVYRRAVDDAQEALTSYADAHPGGPLNERPLNEQIEIQRLTAAVTTAQTNLTAAEQKGEEARLATEQSTSDVSQRLRIIDEPDVASAPEPRLKQAVLTAGFFVFVGLLISLAAIVVATAADRSLRSAEDVEQLLGLPMLAIVPEARSSKRHARHARKQSKDSEPSPAGSEPIRPATVGTRSIGKPVTRTTSTQSKSATEVATSGSSRRSGVAVAPADRASVRPARAGRSDGGLHRSGRGSDSNDDSSAR